MSKKRLQLSFTTAKQWDVGAGRLTAAPASLVGPCKRLGLDRLTIAGEVVHANGESYSVENGFVTFSSKDGREHGATITREGDIFVRATPSEERARNRAWGKLVTVIEANLSHAAGQDAAEDLGIDTTDPRSVGSYLRTRGSMAPGQLAHTLYHREGAPAAGSLSWGTGISALDEELAEAIGEWASARALDLSEADRAVVSAAWDMFQTVLADDRAAVDAELAELGTTYEEVSAAAEARRAERRGAARATFGRASVVTETADVL